MNASAFLDDLRRHARVDGNDDDLSLQSMLATAAQDVATAAAYTLPDDAAELPEDLRFAIVDQALRTFDARGADEIRPGLSPAAARVAARYRGVRIDTPETTDE